jgi:hypothetical protein
LHILKIGNFGAAVGTPGGPEYQNHLTAPEISKAHFVAIDIRKGEVRGRGAGLQEFGGILQVQVLLLGKEAHRHKKAQGNGYNSFHTTILSSQRYKKTSVLISFIGPSLLIFENKIVSMHKIIKYI